MNSLKGKVAIITGAGRGLGRGIALRLAEDGCNIVAADVVPAEETVELAREVGVQADYYVVDVSNQEQVQGLIDFVVEKYGTVDILVNNAGINRDGMLHKITPENWDLVLLHPGRSASHAREELWPHHQYFLRELAGKYRTGELCCLQSWCGGPD